MKLRDYIIIGGLFLIALVSFIVITSLNSKSGNTGIVYQGSQKVIEVDFTKNEVKTYPQIDYPDYPKTTTPLGEEGADRAYIIMGDYLINGKRTEVVIEINFEIKSIRIERDQTPKQIGVFRNWYNGNGLPVVSLPNLVYIKFENKVADDDVDGYVWEMLKI